MEGFSAKAEQSGTAINDEKQGSYDMVNSCALKKGITSLMLKLKEAEIKAETISVHMNQEKTKKQQPKDTN